MKMIRPLGMLFVMVVSWTGAAATEIYISVSGNNSNFGVEDSSCSLISYRCIPVRL